MPPSENAYQGASGQTVVERRVHSCRCGARFAVELRRSIDAAADPADARDLVAGRANRARCALCGLDEAVDVTVLLHDPARALMVLFVPEALRPRELEERGRLYLALAADGAAAPRYVRELRVAVGLDELRALAAPASAGEAADRAAGPVAPAVSPRSSSPGEGDGAAAEATRSRVPIADAHAAAVEGWVASRAPALTVLVEHRVLHLVALPPDEAAPFLAGPLELRVQLHRLPSYPVLALTLLAPSTAGRRPALHAPLEVGRAAHQQLLARLAQQTRLSVEVYTSEHAPIGRRAVVAPLEANVARLLAAAQEALHRIPAPQRDFEAARRMFGAADYDRLGRVEPDFTAAQGSLEGARAVRRAVAEVARWSEAGAEAYLLEIRSFPLLAWNRLRAAVVRRALELGVHARKALVERVLEEGGLDVDWPEVLQRQLRAFAALASGQQPSDLQPEEEAENWRLLLGECRNAGIQADPEIRALVRSRPAPAPAGAARGSDEPSFDPQHTPTEELVLLLDRRELRRAAALALCERRNAAALSPMFHALPRMTRSEVNRVLPALVAAFADAAIPLLVEGLRARKSYLRQGCALGLGTLGRAPAVEPLIELLVSEPTEVWREVARAVGDLGVAALGSIVSRLRAATGEEERERLVRALAHVAGRGEREEVQGLASSPDPAIAEPSRRALALLDEVVRAEREVRVEAPRDQTVVRAFSRRFFEALGEDAELADLAPHEITEGEPRAADAWDDDGEMLDEADVVEEALLSRGDDTQPRLVLPSDRGT